MIKRLNDFTIFFVKSHVDLSTSEKVIQTLEDSLNATGGFKKNFAIRTPPLSREFYQEFYKPKDWWTDLPEMIDDLLSFNRGIALCAYSGRNITNRVKEKLGPTKYKDNIGKGTIREMFMNPDEPCWRTVAHAPKPEEVVHDISVLKKYKLLG